jgi:putative flippase GtrA
MRTSWRPSGAPFRFLLSGALNTAATYALYLVLLQVLTYAIAYSIAFVTGIALAYVLSRFFVFRSGGGTTAIVLFPLVYVGQYLIGLVVVVIWVDVLDLPAEIASLVAVIVTIPITYRLSRTLFVRRHREGDAD